ncbi:MULTISPECIES: NAD-glutamate dehydrogenase [Nocardiopsis]|uniref:NAD-glutamate dehydrogenase n=1 Tax=Nocardiopsis sinuspersici TaxID=501010 RepID=A0A1V3C441_9ACTN|nr:MULTISPECIES: NAD-glutamate dehydrogenase [Nocardiopsis]OOC55296.1 NAD-glutamate dehydrogenase [Nocardiopsis sinuspersici]
MSGQSDVHLQKLLSDAAAKWSPGARISPEEADAVRRFLPVYYRHTDPEEISGRSPEQICGPAEAHLAFGTHRAPGRAKVRVYTPDAERDGWDQQTSVLEVVTDNAPFLVSSVTMALGDLGAGVRLVVHPQMTVGRDLDGRLRQVDPEIGGEDLLPIDESWMHIEIDPQSDPGRVEEIAARVENVLADVRYVDEDAAKMSDRAIRIADELAAYPDRLVAGGVDPREIGESVDFLRWTAGRHFTFMGYREYSLVTDDNGDDSLRPEPGSGLGVLRMDPPDSTSFAALPPEIRAKAREPYILVLTKANSRATVYRPKYLDYVGVKKFDAQGNIVGERRFLGLFTSQANTTSISQIPIMRRKQAEVLSLAGFEADSYDGRDLIELLETFPREELLQIPVGELYNIVRGVLRLRDRRGTKLFMRRDPYGGRYMSCFVYMPRDQYSTRVRLDIQNVLADAFEGATMDHNVLIGSAPLARLYLVARARHGQTLADIDQVALEEKVRQAARSWDADLDDALAGAFGPMRATELKDRYAGGLTEAYKVDNGPAAAADDIAQLERLLNRTDPERRHGEFSAVLYQREDADPGCHRFRLYRIGEPISLSRVLPVLENLGVEVVDERPYDITVRDVGTVWVYDFGLGPIPESDLAPARLKALFEEAFDASWRDLGESDRFNALVVRAGLDWRQLTVLRAYAKYLRQTGSTFTPEYLADILVANVGIANLLVELFEARFDPDQPDEGRDERTGVLVRKIEGELDAVASLDHDRVLRSFLAVIRATLRTNHYQGHPYLVLKLNPQQIPDLPNPRPRYEMYVYSTRMEGVHLRFGAVARGGLRWSDRLEDFRTEVLGLVKAQMVKNAVIVPSGAKGGFVCKRLPQNGTREEVRAEVVSCYKQFVSGLLDVTDNLVDGETVHPERTVLHDGDDSYLVVAADKGTATFSDTANAISTERGFWLGDAFASGGSVGYDHKAMGITARGAWESVRYHFREMGVNVQEEPFTVVGVGDMSGDVFGNGMLLSKQIRLIAAFDHRHVFLDPDPDPHTSWVERKRVFDLPRSTWEDYDPKLISEGGGVHPRTAKSVPVTPQVREALGIEEEVEALTPDELIRYVLTAPVDLLWNGGIGTYVKASTETHADVGDKTNDQLRVDAADLRVKVIGEGGNLGLTQDARIEFAREGGRVNTDFIDNSAGVDTSDHEVNIKIMLDREVRSGKLDKDDRDQLFIDMTDEVAELVLDNNYAQNTALAASRKQDTQMLHVHGRYMRYLERSKVLKRKQEDLPSDKAIAERRAAGAGLTGPEFATLLSYTKISLKDQIGLSDLADDPYLADTLTGYFPTPLRSERFAEGVASHPLRREIIVNQVVNHMVNHSGVTFAFRLNEELGANPADIARAYLVVQEVLGLRRFWGRVEELDHRISVDNQLSLLLETRKLAERSARWLLRNRTFPFDISSEIGYFAEGVGEVLPRLDQLLRGRDREAFVERRDRYTSMGVPTELAEQVAVMVPAYSTLDLVEISHRTGRPVEKVAELYFELADRLNISWWRERIIDLPRDDRWATTARASLRDDLYAAHADLTARVLESGPAEELPELIAEWLDQNRDRVERAGITLSEIQENERFDLATLSVALRSFRGLVG